MSLFRSKIKRLKCLSCGVELVRFLMLLLAFLPLLFALLALADWQFAFTEDTRAYFLPAMLAVCSVLFLIFLLRLRRRVQQLPNLLDAFNHDERSRIVLALNVGEGTDTPSGLNRWLLQQVVSDALEALDQSCDKRPFLKRLRACSMALIISVFAVMGVQTLAPHAFNVLSSRILFPHDDIPPLSSYTFEPVPALPVVHYGEDVSLGCRISGDAAVSQDVVLLLKVDGVPLQVLPTFRNRDGVYLRLLENVTADYELAFAFADGSARSQFYPLRVDRRPRVLSGVAVVTPMEYTGLPSTEYVLGGRELRVPDGATVEFSLECNLPIKRAVGQFKPEGESALVEIEGRVDGKRMSLSYILRSNGTMTLRVYDAAGRESDVPVQIRMAVLPDSPPRVQISHPYDGMLLVEGQPLDITVEADDDYGVARLSLFKALAPYRQHGIEHDCSARQKSVALKQTFNTQELGFKAGDVIELRAEVADDNPFRFNLLSSPTTKVHVISSEQYAELLRLELAHEQFMARYEELSAALESLEKALETASQAPVAEREAALEQAARALADAHAVAQSIGRDFPAFDMDSELSDLASQIADVLEQQQREISQLNRSLPQEEWESAVRLLLNRLSSQKTELDEQKAQAQQVDLLSSFMELRARLVRIAEEQVHMSEILRRFMREFGYPVTTQPSRLEGLGADQALIRDELRAWIADADALRADLAARPELEQIAAILLQVTLYCETHEVDGLMDQAVEQASLHQSSEASSFAAKAAEVLKQLLENEANQSSCSNAVQQCASGLCQSAQNTLAQMLNALCNSEGSFAAASKGVSQSAAHGSSDRGVRGGTDGTPGSEGRMQGPARGTYKGHKSSRPSAGPVPDGGAAPSPSSSGSQPYHDLSDEVPNLPGQFTEQVPPGYRDAVRSYFKK